VVLFFGVINDDLLFLVNIFPARVENNEMFGGLSSLTFGIEKNFFSEITLSYF